MHPENKNSDAFANMLCALGILIAGFLAQHMLADAWDAQWITWRQMLVLAYLGALTLIARGLMKHPGRHRANT